MRHSKATRIALAALFLILSASGAAAAEPLSLQDILANVEKRYTETRFCTEFTQVSRLSGMGITDTAKGSVCFAHPDKMRWEYTSPEEQLIISDGKLLWIYKPVDKQVLVGQADEFFGNGEGASFFSDISVLTDAFDITFAEGPRAVEATDNNCHALVLSPKTPRPEMERLILYVDKDTYDITMTLSSNAYGDETRLHFSPPDFDPDISEELFYFSLPEGVDVLELDSP